MDYYIKAVSKDAFWQSMVDAGMARKVEDEVADEEGEVSKVERTVIAEGVYVDEIGAVWKPTGEVYADTGAPVMECCEGYHVNLRVVCPLTEMRPPASWEEGTEPVMEECDRFDLSALPVIDCPGHPYRVWA